MGVIKEAAAQPVELDPALVQRLAEIRLEENRRHRAEHYVRMFNRGLITVVELAESTTEIAVCERCAEPWDELNMLSSSHATHGWLA